jgi:hypothetical protein
LKVWVAFNKPLKQEKRSILPGFTASLRIRPRYDECGVETVMSRKRDKPLNNNNKSFQK